MLKELIIALLPKLIYFVVAIIMGFISYTYHKWVKAHQNFLELQRQQLIQQMGQDKYNHEVEMAQGIVKTVEQMGRQFNWAGEAKHAKATEMISQKTGLSPDDIYNIIMATVAEFNKNKPKAA